MTWSKQFKDVLLEINQYVYFKINNNFKEFYSIVQNFNTFEVETNDLLTDIDDIRGKMENTKTFVESDIRSLQRKIEKRQKLSQLQKLLETIKYIDKANSTIKTLLDKTNYKKISELLVVLNSNFNKNMTDIKIFENRFGKIAQLKSKFFKQLITIAINKLSCIINNANESYIGYIEEFDEEKSFTITFESNDAKEINSIITELRLFGKEKSLYKRLISEIQSTLGKFNKTVTKRISKMIVFKEPSLMLLKSYRSYINHLYSVYQVTVPIEDNDDIYNQFLSTLTKNSNIFIREVLAVFNLECIAFNQIKEFLKVIGSFDKFSHPENNESLFENLQIYFKKIVLNARQCNFFASVKTSMEEEDWIVSSLPTEIETILKKKLSSNNISFNSKYIVIEEDKFFFTKSFFAVITYFEELESLNTELDDLLPIYESKLTDAIELYLKNCEILLLNGKALRFKKVKKINTKILSSLTRSFRFTVKLSLYLYLPSFNW